MLNNLDLNNIMFFIKNLKTRHDGFDIKSYISFVTGNTRLATSNKLQHNRSTDMMANNFISIDFYIYGMPYQLLTSIFIQTTSNRNYCITFGTILKLLLIYQIPVTFLFSAVAPSVTINLPPLTLIYLISCNNLYIIYITLAAHHKPSYLWTISATYEFNHCTGLYV